MKFSRTYDHFTSFALSAMLTASFLATAPGITIEAAAGPQPVALMGAAVEGLRASGWQGLKDAMPSSVASIPPASPVTPVAATPASLTIAQIQRLSALTVKYGVDGPMNQKMTDALGLTKPGETLSNRQLNIAPPKKIGHSYQVLPDGGYLFMLITDVSSLDFRTDAQFALISAVSMSDGNLVVIPVPQAQSDLPVEIAFWGGVADKF